MRPAIAVTKFISAFTDTSLPNHVPAEQISVDPNYLISKEKTTDTYVIAWQGADFTPLHNTSDDPAKSIADPQGVTHSIGIAHIVAPSIAINLEQVELYERMQEAAAKVKAAIDHLNANKDYVNPFFYRTAEVGELQIDRSEDTNPQVRTLITINAVENTT